MLCHLRVRNLAIIDSLEVEFGAGLNVVTGETGAGKSILVTALKLVLGERSVSDFVRTGCTEGYVEAVFDTSHSRAMRERLEDTGIPVEDGELIVRRVIRATGRSKAYLNGTLATVAQLREIVGHAAHVTSQHEHQRLVESSTQREYLDAFAGLNTEVSKMGERYLHLRELDKKVREFEAALKNKNDRADLLRHTISEIEEVSPTPGEVELLQEEQSRLRNANTLRETAALGVHALTERDDSVISEIGRLATKVGHAAEHDTRLQETRAQLEEAQALLDESSRSLLRYLESIQFDDERLQEVDDRLDRLRNLERKYGGSVERALGLLKSATHELEQLDSAESNIESLRADREKAWGSAKETARKLSVSRKRHARKVETAIARELREMGMGDAVVTVEVEEISGADSDLSVGNAKLTRHGLDRVEFLISPKPRRRAKTDRQNRQRRGTLPLHIGTQKNFFRFTARSLLCIRRGRRGHRRRHRRNRWSENS